MKRLTALEFSYYWLYGLLFFYPYTKSQLLFLQAESILFLFSFINF
jgi:hypothetical protein